MDAVYKVALWAVLIIGMVIGLYIMSMDAKAHTAHTGMTYHPSCCHGNAVNGDCQPIPDSAVRSIPGGYQITLRPGDHTFVTKEHVFTKEARKTRRSTDGRYHACLYPNEDHLHCFYAPPMLF